MSRSTVFGTIGFLVLLSVIALRELRFTKQLNALRAEQRAAAEASAAAAAARDASQDETREAIRQVSRAREELAAARQSLSSAAGQIHQLQAQINSLSQQPLTDRSPRRRSPLVEPLDFNPALEPGQARRRSWGHEQATGAPDTLQAGDVSTAWAPREQDGGEEWLQLGYSNHVQLAEVRVRETYNPGAISKVVAVLPGGQEIVIWEGVDEPGQAPVEKSFPVSGNITASNVKVYLDTKRVPGWNEIDAVELVGRDGSRQWASQSVASSSYADPR